jgi:hypothetical protein
MKNPTKQDATTRADNLDDPTARDTGRLPADEHGAAYPNKANDSDGKGSPYGGTKTADADAPDGNQQVNRQNTGKSAGEGALPEDMGDEYNSPSSYGDKGDDKPGDDNGPGDARGYVIR